MKFPLQLCRCKRSGLFRYACLNVCASYNKQSLSSLVSFIAVFTAQLLPPSIANKIDCKTSRSVDQNRGYFCCFVLL